MDKPEFYMQIIRDPDTEQVMNLEKDFKGMKYVSCKGLLSRGKQRMYTESWAEKSGVDVYLPIVTTVDSTEITFEFVFVGESRMDTFLSFTDYITGEKIRYWDNVRNMKVEIVLSEKVEPSDDILLGSTPYIKSTFKFTNINGLHIKA